MNVFFAWRLAARIAAEGRRACHGRDGRCGIPAWMAVRHPGAPLARLLWIYGVGMLAFSAMTSVLALYLGAEFGLDETTIGLRISLRRRASPS